MSGLVLVHLLWAPLGPDPVARFASAYRAHAAGCPHRTAVVFNGFPDAESTASAAEALAGIDYEAVVLDGAVQDIAAYLEAARRLDAEFLCFVNSHGEPLADNWLGMLARHAARPGVGLVGATGSWESHLTNTLRAREPWPRAVHPRRWAGWARRSATWARAAFPMRAYPAFPNPHIRTNAFMIRRALLAQLRPGPLVTKADAHRFESGRSGLTRQVARRGLATLIVGRDGVGYAPDDWPCSRTYRSGDQENLLVADNRTRIYADAGPDARAAYARAAWGRRG